MWRGDGSCTRRKTGGLMNSAFRHAKFQAPLAIMRSGISDVWRAAFSLAGRYRPLESGETESFDCGDVSFFGDIPVHAGREPRQTCKCFISAPPLVEEVNNLVVTPSGAGWKDGVLYEKYSSSKPGLRSLATLPIPSQEIDDAYFIQSEHTDTFGDWMAEYLAPLSRVGEITAPVVLPARMGARPYVNRDAARLGVKFISVEKPLCIKKAKVVRQTKYIRYWTAPETVALRDFLNIKTPQPDPGSIVYLSRYGEASEVAVRTHPNLAIEKTVRDHGGLVIRTAEASLDDYLAASSQAETVVFDHGSAGYNMIYWRPKRVVEIVSDAWWMNAFLFYANAIGVDNYWIIRSDNGGKARLREKLSEALAQPLSSLRGRL